jgi:single-stranded-DNA-specific exonuclease
MPDLIPQWQLQPQAQPPDWFLGAVRQTLRKISREGVSDQHPVPDISDSSKIPGQYIARLLWQRKIQAPEQLSVFLNPQDYQPTAPLAFGQEMSWAIARLQSAYATQEKVAIWGDFDADGVTATAVLWDGLGEFFVQQTTLFYYIPNRLTECHGLSESGLDRLHQKGCKLIVTCDTGSTNHAEIEYANHLGMEVIVTDHHTLPSDRPPVVAIINPRFLPADHPLAHLSGVAVAYKLVEALYAALPTVPQKPLEKLLDLVAIGLIADLVELKGDCRYLAQLGIAQLQKQANPATATRPGVAKLLEFCKRSGDRPTDISFGLGPRINAVSRIQGDAHFCIELLTSQDKQLCSQLAEATELANTRRKALQKDLVQQVKARITQVDLSNTPILVLADDQWPAGILGLVAGQIAQEYGKPTILFSSSSRLPTPDSPLPLARGSARSVHSIDLYQLVKQQAHLLHRFGGHPYAAGLSLPVENLPLFTEALHQQFRQHMDEVETGPSFQVDLVVTVAELGKELFQELKLLEPCGMGNPVPKLWIRNAWFAKLWHRKIQDRQGRTVTYIKTEFELWDSSVSQGFPGVWWGHYREEIPSGQCDVLVELDFNTYLDKSKGKRPHYEVRLVAVRPCQPEATLDSELVTARIWDWRGRKPVRAQTLEISESSEGSSSDSFAMEKQVGEVSPLLLGQCPSSWAEFQAWVRRSHQEQRPLALAYEVPSFPPAMEIWRQLVGVAKYLSRTRKIVTRQQLFDKLGIGDQTLQQGLKSLRYLGFEFTTEEAGLQVCWHSDASATFVPISLPLVEDEFRADFPIQARLAQESCDDENFQVAIAQFLNAVQEEQFQRQYFFQIPIPILQAAAIQLCLSPVQNTDNS